MVEKMSKMTPTGAPSTSIRYPYLGKPTGVGCFASWERARCQYPRVRRTKPFARRVATPSRSEFAMGREWSLEDNLDNRIDLRPSGTIAFIILLRRLARLTRNARPDLVWRVVDDQAGRV